MRDKQRVIFVSGKGGVGKSHVAANIAFQESNAKKRTLLVELGEFSYFSHRLKTSVGSQPKNFAPHLDLAIWSGKECLYEYALHLIRIESLCRLFFENPISRTLINIAPSLAELAIIGKITSGLRNVGPQLPYDCIVVDAFASGHFEALLKAPKGMSEAVPLGPMGEQTRSIIEALKHCEYYIVTSSEELPLIEAMELWPKVHQITGVSPQFVLNQYAPLDTKEVQESSLTDAQKTPLLNLCERQKEVLGRISEFLEQESSGAVNTLGVCMESVELKSPLKTYSFKEAAFTNEFVSTGGESGISL